MRQIMSRECTHCSSRNFSRYLRRFRRNSTVDDAAVYNDLSDEMQEYETFIVDKLLSNSLGILSTTAINEKDDTYQAWNDGTISLRSYLMYAASQNWIDVSALTQDDAYLDSQEVYQKLTELILDRLTTNTTFAKKLYHYMLLQDMLDGYDICNLMYDQNLLTKEDDGLCCIRCREYDTVPAIYPTRLTNWKSHRRSLHSTHVPVPLLSQIRIPVQFWPVFPIRVTTTTVWQTRWIPHTGRN